MAEFVELVADKASDLPVISPLKAHASKKRYYENKFMPSGASPARFIVAGKSGSGKSVLMTSMILKGYLGIPDRIQIFCSSAHQDVYEPYKALQAKLPKGAITFHTELSELKLEDLDPKKRNFIIIDDFSGKKALWDRSIKDAFFRGRHFGCTMFVLAQNYYNGVPMELRQNSTCTILFRCWNGRREIRSIADGLADDCPKDLFVECLQKATAKPYGFMYIEPGASDRRLRFRDGFANALVVPED